jgi:hypothetical protein
MATHSIFVGMMGQLTQKRDGPIKNDSFNVSIKTFKNFADMVSIII